MGSKVYFVKAKEKEGPRSISEKVVSLFDRANFKTLIKKDLVALKIHFGEKDNIGYIKPYFLLNLIGKIKNLKARPFFTDANVIYKSSRQDAVDHLNLAYEHGFSHSKTGISLIIADGLTGNDFLELQINKKHFQKIKVSKLAIEADVIISFSHLTGHLFTGFGASLKNIGMGFASKAGKLNQHSDIAPKILKDVCTRCGSCFKVCPAKAIKKKGESYFIDERICIGCGECLIACRFGAIDISWAQDTVKLQERMAEYAYGIL